MSDRKYPVEPRAPAVLAVDVGGSHVKAVLNGVDERRRFVSGHKMTAEEMVDGVLEQTADWDYVGVSVGVPGPVIDGKVVREPVNLGHGLGRVRLRDGVRQADEGDQRRGHAGARELRGRPDALPRPRHRARHDADHRRSRRPHGARAPAVPEGDVRGLRRRAGLERDGHKRWQKHVVETIEYLVARALARLRRARRRQRQRARRAAAELPPRPQRGRVPRRLPPLGRGRARR